MIYTSEQLHQLAHVAWPGLYQAAMSGGEVWFSLWDGDKRVKKAAPLSTRLRIVERENYLGILGEDRSFVAPRKLSKPRVGFSVTKDGEPIHFEDSFTRPVQCGDPVYVHSFKAEVEPA